MGRGARRAVAAPSAAAGASPSVAAAAAEEEFAGLRPRPPRPPRPPRREAPAGRESAWAAAGAPSPGAMVATAAAAAGAAASGAAGAAVCSGCGTESVMGVAVEGNKTLNHASLGAKGAQPGQRRPIWQTDCCTIAARKAHHRHRRPFAGRGSFSERIWPRRTRSSANSAGGHRSETDWPPVGQGLRGGYRAQRCSIAFAPLLRHAPAAGRRRTSNTQRPALRTPAATPAACQNLPWTCCAPWRVACAGALARARAPQPQAAVWPRPASCRPAPRPPQSSGARAIAAAGHRVGTPRCVQTMPRRLL